MVEPGYSDVLSQDNLIPNKTGPMIVLCMPMRE